MLNYYNTNKFYVEMMYKYLHWSLIKVIVAHIVSDKFRRANSLILIYPFSRLTS